MDGSSLRRLNLISSLLFGVFYAIGFSLMTWGYDGLTLHDYGDLAPWDKLLLGLPIMLLIGLLAGWLGASTSSTLVPMLVWGVAGCGVGLLVGHIPFEGINLITWLREPRLWGEIIYNFGQAAHVRTILITIVITILGFFIGGIKNTAIHWSWDQVTKNQRLSWKSLFVLWVSLPIAFLQAGAAHLFMYQPLREPQRAIAETIKIILQEEELSSDSQKVGLRSLQPYLEYITSNYITHLVGFSKNTESWYSGYIDLEVNSKLILRCVTVGDRVVYCDNHSDRLNSWVGDLVSAGLTGEQPWLQDPMKPLFVNEGVISWLGSMQSHLSETYEIKIDRIIRGAYFIVILFHQDFSVQCRFHGVEPVVVDECVIGPSSMQTSLPGY